MVKMIGSGCKIQDIHLLKIGYCHISSTINSIIHRKINTLPLYGNNNIIKEITSECYVCNFLN